jgi:hypothetical protein
VIDAAAEGIDTVATEEGWFLDPVELVWAITRGANPNKASNVALATPQFTFFILAGLRNTFWELIAIASMGDDAEHSARIFTYRKTRHTDATQVIKLALLLFNVR